MTGQGAKPSGYLAGSVLIWAPPGRGRRVPGATPFSGWKKNAAGSWRPQFQVFNKNGPFWPPKNPGACFWARKQNLREWPHAIPRFSIKTNLFGRRKTQGHVLGGEKSPCGKHADSHPGFGQGPVSNPASPGRPGLEPGLPRVRRPCASPLGNLTTVPPLAGQLSSCLSHPREG